MGHSIHKHMKSFQSRELTDMPLTSDMTGEGAGRNLGSPAHRFGAMKGDQSATHRDYANFKDTDPGYHGSTGSSHGDQSATHRDYMGPTQQGKVETKGGGVSEERKNLLRRQRAAQLHGYEFDAETNKATLPNSRTINALDYHAEANLGDEYPRRAEDDVRSKTWQKNRAEKGLPI